MSSVLIMNGPNINLLGSRKKDIYGSTTYDSLQEICTTKAKSLNLQVTFFQSNHEGELIDKMQSAQKNFSGIIINAGGLSHTSICIRDAVEDCNLPVFEVHISNISNRERFRHSSLLSPVVQGVLFGFGIYGYELALTAFHDIYAQK